MEKLLLKEMEKNLQNNKFPYLDTIDLFVDSFLENKIIDIPDSRKLPYERHLLDNGNTLKRKYVENADNKLSIVADLFNGAYLSLREIDELNLVFFNIDDILSILIKNQSIGELLNSKLYEDFDIVLSLNHRYFALALAKKINNTTLIKQAENLVEKPLKEIYTDTYAKTIFNIICEMIKEGEY